VSEGAYWNSVDSAVEWKDVYGGILKSISFGLIVSWVCCYKGFYTRQSAEGLGRATTEAVVLSSVLILVVDYFLTSSCCNPMIRLVGVEKKLGGQPVLQGVDLSIPVGKLTTIIGRSGEGKSVLLKHMIGLLQPDRGEVWVGDVEISRLSGTRLNDVRKQFAMLFQGAALFDSLSVFENVAFPLREKLRMKGRRWGDGSRRSWSKLGWRGWGTSFPPN
jgi:ABC-type transport system involved in resistance to organic solvents, ATPase component